MELAPGAQLDRFVIERQLGQGAMAVVYLARHATLGTKHAVKVLQITTPAVKQRLVQEGRVQATLRHPNIVAVSDVIEMHGSPVLVMELVEGMALDDLIKKGPLTLEQVDDLARGIIAGVAHAHRLGVLHRDLKPANVMLAVTDRGIVPKVSDFGLAKVIDAGEGVTKTKSGTTMGTPCYMAPEQIRNAKNVDRRADVWAVGTILYEMLCGVRAFDGEDLIDVFSVVSKGEYVPITERVPDVPERMVQAIAGALTVDKERRIADCDQLLKLWTSEATPAPAVPRGPWAGVVENFKRSPGPTLTPSSTAAVTAPEPKVDATWSDGSSSPAASTLGDEPELVPPKSPITSTLGDTAPAPSTVRTVQTSLADQTEMRKRPVAIAALDAPPAEAPTSRWGLAALGVVGVLALLALGGGGLGLVAAAGLVANSALTTPTEAEVTDAPALSGAIAAPPSEPAVDAAPAPSAPVAAEVPAPAAVEPVAEEKPAAKAPAPKPTESKAAKAEPKPTEAKPAVVAPPPEPTPAVVTPPPPPVEVAPVAAAPAVPKLVVKGDVPTGDVALRNAAKKYVFAGDEVPAGTYDIFIDLTTRAGSVTVAAGQKEVVITCIAGEKKCTS